MKMNCRFLKPEVVLLVCGIIPAILSAKFLIEADAGSIPSRGLVSSPTHKGASQQAQERPSDGTSLHLLRFSRQSVCFAFG
jgi:hypothetical protein